MSGPYLRFEDGKISLAGQNLMVNSADLTINPSLSAERVYGDYDANIAGAKTQFIDFNPTQGIQGKLNIDFYISADTFAQDGQINNINRMFDIKEGMSEKPVNGNKIGRYTFDNAYLTSFGFSFQPFKVIRANASYDIYGSIEKSGVADRFKQASVDFAHGLKSFGNMTASGTDIEDAVDRQFEITSLDYKIIVNRKIHHRIRALENTQVDNTASGVVPVRVSTEAIEKEVQISANEMIPQLNAYGSQQKTNFVNTSDSTISAFLYSLQGNRIARFDCSGKILNQSINISEGNYYQSKISVKEIIK